MSDRLKAGDVVEILSGPDGERVGAGIVKEPGSASNPRALVRHTEGIYAGIETVIHRSHLRLKLDDFQPRFQEGEVVRFRGQRVWVDKYCPQFRTSGMARVVFVADRHAAWVLESDLSKELSR